jgi:hypothetical protein
VKAWRELPKRRRASVVTTLRVEISALRDRLLTNNYAPSTKADIAVHEAAIAALNELATVAADAALIASAPTISAHLAEAVALLRRAREHIADREPRDGACGFATCGHRWCADIAATNEERTAVVQVADAFLARIDAEKGGT